MDSKKQLKNIIESSNLSAEDKKMWNNFIEAGTEIQVGMVYDFLKDNAEELEFMTSNLKAKIEAVSQKDQSKLEEIKKSEEEYLKKYQ